MNSDDGGGERGHGSTMQVLPREARHPQIGALALKVHVIRAFYWFGEVHHVYRRSIINPSHLDAM